MIKLVCQILLNEITELGRKGLQCLIEMFKSFRRAPNVAKITDFLTRKSENFIGVRDPAGKLFFGQRIKN